MPFRSSRLPVEIAAFALASLSLASLAATGRADDCVNGPAGSGHASSFTYTPGSGACRFGGEEGNAFVAAVGPTDYAGSAMCGRFVRVTGPLGWVDVRVVDECARSEERR